MNNSSSSRAEDFAAAAILFVTSVPGLVLCVMTAVAYHQLRNDLSKSFALLMVLLCVTDALCIAPMAFWAPPLTITQDEEVAESFLGRRMAHSADFSWFASSYQVLLIAVSRLLGMVAPMWYNVNFTTRNILIMVGFTYILALGFTWNDVGDFFGYNCNLIYSAPNYAWYFMNDTCKPYRIQSSLYSNNIVIVLLCIVTAATIVALLRMGKEDSEEQRKSDMKFMKVSLFNIVIWLGEATAFHVPGWIENPSKWLTFVSSNWLWVVCHMSNGLANFFLVGKVRRQILANFGIKNKVTPDAVTKQAWSEGDDSSN